jgi:putative endonuclease
MRERFLVYILTNDRQTVLYTGITNDLLRLVGEHRAKLIRGFTERYNVHKLVYYEEFSDPRSAIEREKQIKAGSRTRQVALIDSMNPDWRDLFDGLV